MKDTKAEELYYSTVKGISIGEVVKGRIVQIKNNEVLVDIGYKSEGMIPLANFKAPTELKVGDEVEVLVEAEENREGMVGLSLEKADFIKHWERIQKAYHSQEIIKGKIAKMVKGGFTVNLGIPAFLPSSQADIEPLKNPDELVGKEVELKILKTDQRRNNVIVSRKAYLEEMRQERKKKLLQTLQPKDIIEGKVKNITDFGAFLDLGGLDGLLHITDISWGRISHPSEVVAIGDKIEVTVLEIDKEKERVLLGLKQKTTDPWEAVEEKYPLYSKVKGGVVNITNYGVFIELEKGIEGLVHISELSWRKHISHPSQVVSMGDMIEAVVINIDKINKKIALSLKQTEPDPWLKIKGKYTKGSIAKGRIYAITDYGVFVELEEGVEGLLHISDLSWSLKGEHPSQLVKKGEKIEVMILDVDSSQRRISLGRKQLLPNPWEKVAEKYGVGMELKGTVTKVTEFGAFVEIEEGVEGLLHISQMNNSIDIFKSLRVEDEIKVKIIRFAPEERRIGLSLIEKILKK